jgi:hypothetical protein
MPKPKAKPKTGIGYEDDICHFCGENEAAYGREDKGKLYDACFKCAVNREPKASK